MGWRNGIQALPTTEPRVMEGPLPPGNCETAVLGLDQQEAVWGALRSKWAGGPPSLLALLPAC